MHLTLGATTLCPVHVTRATRLFPPVWQGRVTRLKCRRLNFPLPWCTWLHLEATLGNRLMLPCPRTYVLCKCGKFPPRLTDIPALSKGLSALHIQIPGPGATTPLLLLKAASGIRLISCTVICTLGNNPLGTHIPLECGNPTPRLTHPAAKP